LEWRFGIGAVERGVEKWEKSGDLLLGLVVEKWEGVYGENWADFGLILGSNFAVSLKKNYP
jgi:hypothetical protein